MVKKRVTKKKKGGISSAGMLAALFLLGALVLVIIVIVNWDRITGNLKATDFFNRIGAATPEFVETADEEASSNGGGENDVPPETLELNVYTGESSRAPVMADAPAEERGTASAAERGETTESAPAGGEIASPSEEESAPPRPAEAESTASAPVPMNLTLYFMTMNSAGYVSRVSSVRQMEKSDSPLADAINALIAGPTEDEERDGCRTYISGGTRLLGASVRGETATLNFSEEFEFNQYGIEGLRGQLQQIVFTATAFPTVRNVQFLVNGEKRDYLGSEGVWIGSPLDRNSF